MHRWMKISSLMGQEAHLGRAGNKDVPMGMHGHFELPMPSPLP